MAGDLLHPKDKHAIQLVHGAQQITGLVEQIWDVDPRQWVGAMNDDLVARHHAPQRLAGPQRRQWAFQTFEIESICHIWVLDHHGKDSTPHPSHAGMS
jgi:hypothetical protein